MSRKLSHRMRHQYEMRTESWLQRRSNTIIRLKTKEPLTVEEIDKISLHFCKTVSGTQTCFGADREISVLIIDYWCVNTDLWHGGNIQKVVSEAASTATLLTGKLFTASTFSISDQLEVYNYFVWRQKLWVTNQAQNKSRAAMGHDRIQGLSLKIDNPDHGRLAMKIGRLWSMVSPPLFTEDSDFMTMLLPRYPKVDDLAP